MRTHKTKEKFVRILAEEYFHIENGGYKFRLYQKSDSENFEENQLPYLEISSDFWHSDGSITLCEKITPKMLEDIGKMFIRAAGTLKEVGGCFNNEKNCVLNEELQAVVRVNK